MDKQRARLLVDCNRMAYICDPQECGHEYDENNGWCKNCQEHYEALVIAVECMDKQIPKKPIARKHNELKGEILFHCPTCDDDFNCNEYEEAHCAECGQAIDWSDSND